MVFGIIRNVRYTVLCRCCFECSKCENRNVDEVEADEGSELVELEIQKCEDVHGVGASGINDTMQQVSCLAEGEVCSSDDLADININGDNLKMSDINTDKKEATNSDGEHSIGDQELNEDMGTDTKVELEINDRNIVPSSLIHVPEHCYHCCLCMCCPFALIGYVLTVVLVLTFLVLTTQMLFLMLVDVIRTLVSSLRILIFVVSIFVYVSRTGAKFNDKYRQLKNNTFRVLLKNWGLTDITLNPDLQRGDYVKYPLVISRGRELAMHRDVFDSVVAEIMPYSKCLMKMLLQIVINLLLVAFFFWIIIEFQVRIIFCFCCLI